MSIVQLDMVTDSAGDLVARNVVDFDEQVSYKLAYDLECAHRVVDGEGETLGWNVLVECNRLKLFQHRQLEGRKCFLSVFVPKSAFSD